MACPKPTKKVFLGPILSMTGSAQHQLAQWLTTIFDTVFLLCSGNYTLNSFTFAKIIKSADFNLSVFLCSFDICSLFIDIPLAKAIEICATTLYELKPCLLH